MEKLKCHLTMQHSYLGRVQSAPGLLCYVSQKAVGQHCNLHPKVLYYPQEQPVVGKSEQNNVSLKLIIQHLNRFE